jgi:hypothetical protein
MVGLWRDFCVDMNNDATSFAASFVCISVAAHKRIFMAIGGDLKKAMLWNATDRLDKKGHFFSARKKKKKERKKETQKHRKPKKNRDKETRKDRKTERQNTENTET